MTSPILLTGGTGTLGRRVVPLLHAAGHTVRVLSRHRHTDRPGIEFVVGDLATGAGITTAVTGVDIILHCAGTAKGDDDKTRTLVRAAIGAGAPHLVYISVVGADRIPLVGPLDRAMFGYFAAKHAAERVIAGSGLTWTTLRATQFHDAMLKAVTAMARTPVAVVPAGFRFQPVDTGEVAAHLVELALAPPAGLVPDLAGPAVHELTDLLRSYLSATHKRRLILPVRLPGKAASALRSGANLAPDRAVGHRTWEHFLDQQFARHPPLT
jgi:uncharacterized protein YbjT (DUF2867 family)